MTKIVHKLTTTLVATITAFALLFMAQPAQAFDAKKCFKGAVEGSFAMGTTGAVVGAGAGAVAGSGAGGIGALPGAVIGGTIAAAGGAINGALSGCIQEGRLIDTVGKLFG